MSEKLRPEAVEIEWLRICISDHTDSINKLIAHRQEMIERTRNLFAQLVLKGHKFEGEAVDE